MRFRGELCLNPPAGAKSLKSYHEVLVPSRTSFLSLFITPVYTQIPRVSLYRRVPEPIWSRLLFDRTKSGRPETFVYSQNNGCL